VHVVGVDGVVAARHRERKAPAAAENKHDRPEASTERLSTDPLDVALLASPDVICVPGAVLSVLDT
jgi:hypothetical protein